MGQLPTSTTITTYLYDLVPLEKSIYWAKGIDDDDQTEISETMNYQVVQPHLTTTLIGFYRALPNIFALLSTTR